MTKQYFTPYTAIDAATTSWGGGMTSPQLSIFLSILESLYFVFRNLWNHFCWKAIG